MDYDLIMLKNQLCFPLYACAKEVVKKYKPYLDELGLTYTQYIAMMVLWEEKTINIKMLGQRLYLDSGTLTPMLKSMEIQGLIERKRSADDERNVIISLTPHGEGMKDSALEIPKKISDCVKIDPEKANILYKLLYEILDNLNK